MDYLVGMLLFVAILAAEMAWHARKGDTPPAVSRDDPAPGG